MQMLLLFHVSLLMKRKFDGIPKSRCDEPPAQYAMLAHLLENKIRTSFPPTNPYYVP